MLNQGQVFYHAGALYVVEEFAEPGMWEDAPALYSCHQLVSTIHFTEHDRAAGLPGCALVTESSWVQPLSVSDEELFETLVVFFQPVYFPAKAADTAELVGILSPETLVRAGVARWNLVFSPELNARLNEEDFETRQGISDASREEISGLW